MLLGLGLVLAICLALDIGLALGLSLPIGLRLANDTTYIGIGLAFGPHLSQGMGRWLGPFQVSEH